MPTEAKQSLYAGLDLHKHNVFCGLIDQEGKPIYRRRLPAELPTILQALEAYRPQLKAVAVESTFNWYWLVDGLQAADYPVHLANPAAMSQYSGLKQTDDETDALWLAELLRLGILPEGYIYPKAERPVRDMLRRRLLIGRQATQTVLSLQSMVTRHTGQAVGATKLFDGEHAFARDVEVVGPRLRMHTPNRRRPRCWSCSAINDACNTAWRNRCWRWPNRPRRFNDW